jgi:hypothetical protein
MFLTYSNMQKTRLTRVAPQNPSNLKLIYIYIYPQTAHFSQSPRTPFSISNKAVDSHVSHTLRHRVASMGSHILFLLLTALPQKPSHSLLRVQVMVHFRNREIDVKNSGVLERKNLLERLLKIADEDNENFLLKLKESVER